MSRMPYAGVPHRAYGLDVFPVHQKPHPLLSNREALSVYQLKMHLPVSVGRQRGMDFQDLPAMPTAGLLSRIPMAIGIAS